MKQCIEKFLNQYETTESQVKQETKKKDKDLERENFGANLESNIDSKQEKDNTSNRLDKICS